MVNVSQCRDTCSVADFVLDISVIHAWCDDWPEGLQNLYRDRTRLRSFAWPESIIMPVHCVHAHCTLTTNYQDLKLFGVLLNFTPFPLSTEIWFYLSLFFLGSFVVIIIIIQEALVTKGSSTNRVSIKCLILWVFIFYGSL